MRMRPLAILFLAAGLSSNPAFAQQPSDAANPDMNGQQLYELGRFAAIYQRVLANYVDDPDPGKLITAAIDGMMGSLDPHSRYVDREAFEDMERDLAGKSAGLGIELFDDRGDLKIERTLPDSPAAKAGLRPGDSLLVIDGSSLGGLDLDEALRKIQGPVGSISTLTIRRPGDAGLLTFSMARAIISSKTIQFETMARDIGYIRIVEFDEDTFDGLCRAALKLRADIGTGDLRGFIVDLRNNPGGMLDQAILVSAAFAGKGVITSVRGRDQDRGKVFVANGADLVDGKPVIVLINGGTASAAEIMAGALQDLRRATILGTRSFGKGSVQTVARMPDDSALILTTARYYTPMGRSIQAQGIEPDILVLQQDAAAFIPSHATRGEAGLVGHLKAQGGKEGSGSSFYVPPDVGDDTQLDMALDLLRGVRQNPAFPPKQLAR